MKKAKAAVSARSTGEGPGARWLVAGEQSWRAGAPRAAARGLPAARPASSLPCRSPGPGDALPPRERSRPWRAERRGPSWPRADEPGGRHVMARLCACQLWLCAKPEPGAGLHQSEVEKREETATKARRNCLSNARFKAAKNKLIEYIRCTSVHARIVYNR